MTFLRVMLIDEHKMFTDALAARLSVATDLWMVGSATPDDARLADVVRALHPDVITTELAPVAGETVGMLRTIRAALPTTHIVMLTDSDDTAYAVAAAREGVAAWVPKASSVEHLLGVLRAVGQGHGYYPPRLLGAVLRVLRDDVRAARTRRERLDVLSHREREVLLRMIEGKPVRQIAAEALVSPNTIRTHVRSILTKLGVHSRLEAVHIARGAGLLPPVDPGLRPVETEKPRSRPGSLDAGGCIIDSPVQVGGSPNAPSSRVPGGAAHRRRLLARDGRPDR